MAEGRIKKVFGGGNTPQGFFSYFDYILPQEDAARLFVVKGGPGVGKSTFMKKIGIEMVSQGYDVEFVHCSSDPESLDGMVIPALKTGFIDGTAPHVVDPKNPGAIDEIINLGDFWNDVGIRKNRKAVMQYGLEIGRLFSRAYRYIKASACIYEDSAAIYSWAADKAAVNRVAMQLVNEVFEETVFDETLADTEVSDDMESYGAEGRQRHLFASAITPDGLVNHLETVLTTERVYAIKGKQGTGTERVLQKIRREAVERGYDTESYYCAMQPTKLEHLVIPGLDVSFTTVNDYHDAAVVMTEVFDLDLSLQVDILEQHADALAYNRRKFEALLTSAVETIHKAKSVHDLLEKYYKENMDFDAVERCMEATLAKIIG